MKLNRNKKLSLLSLLLMVSIAMSMLAVSPFASADYPTYSKIMISPNPVGVNQIAYVSCFMTNPPPSAGMSQVGDLYTGWYVVVTKPGGTTEKITLRNSDAVGGTAATYVPKTVGNYTFQLFYPGQTLKTGTYNNTKMLPSQSDIVTLNVQTEQIGAIYQSPTLPTEYWTRPIYATNWAWADIAGSWYGLGAASFATTGRYDAMGNVQLYTTAPNTGHVVWAKPTHFGGVAGAPISSDQESQYASTSILINFYEPIVLNGIIYYTHYVSVDSKNTGWMAVDLRTGEKVWERTAGEAGNEVLKMGQIMRFHTQQEYGSAAYLWSTAGSGRYRIYDAATGTYMANVSGVVSASFILDYSGIQQGTLLGYYASGGYLTMWNSTNMITNATWNAATFCKWNGNYDWWKGIMWNSTAIPKTGTNVNMNSSQTMSVAAVTPEIILTRYQASAGSFMEMNFGWQITAGFDAKTGQMLWGPRNQSLPYLESIALLCARDGYYVLHNKDTNNAYIYSLKTGELLWGPIQLPGNAYSTISRGGDIAYGKVYIWDLGGFVSAINLATGEIAWTMYPRSSGYDTPFGVYPLWHFGTHTISDGKLFLSEGRMYDPPLSPSYRLAINCTDGSMVWKILSYSGRIPAASADTYLVEWNSFDAQLYTFGKGPTDTTVAAPDVQVPLGNKVLIQGSVMDISAGTKTYEKQSRFANGVPAIADANMSVWMEYVYMQQAKPKYEDIKGVPVQLTAIDPNGNYQDLGKVTSDANGNYVFAYSPEHTGIYRVIASFEGSESYFPSSAQTAILVSEAPAASPTQTPATPTPVLPTPTPPTQTPTPSAAVPPEAGANTALYVAIAAVVAIVVVAVIALFLRRRK
jgi:outer membrane protein assembly factor BamB